MRSDKYLWNVVVMPIYKEIYKKAEPPLDLDEFMDKVNKRKEALEQHTKKELLSLHPENRLSMRERKATLIEEVLTVERMGRGWFMDYFLPQEKQNAIIDKYYKKYKLTKWEKDKCNFELFLGFAPRGYRDGE